MSSKPPVGLFLHEPLFVRSWIDTGYLNTLSQSAHIQIFVPDGAHEIRMLLEGKGLEFSLINLPATPLLHALGRLQWAASTKLSGSLREQRRRVLFGYRDWPQRKNVSSITQAIIEFSRELLRFAQATPLGALLALFPPPAATRPLFVRLSSSGLFARGLSLDRSQLGVMLLPTTGFETWMNTFLMKFRRLGMKTILVPDNWDNLTSKNTLGVLPDAIVTIGDQVSRNLSTQLGVPLSVLHGLGIPKFSGISVATRPDLRNPVKILFLGFSLPYDEIFTLNGLFRLLSKHYPNSFTLYYKPHPNRKARSIQEAQVLPGIKILTADSKYVLPELDNSYNEFLHSFDIVIAPPTTMLLEFVLAGTARVIKDMTIDGIHRTSPGVFSKKWLHVRDIDSLDLPGADGANEIFSLVSGLIEGTKSIRQDVSLHGVISPQPHNYAKNLGKLIQELSADGRDTG